MVWRDELSQQVLGRTPERTETNLRLLFNFLRISPSYALASRQTTRTRLSKKTPPRSKQVIEVFRLLGDVHSIAYEQWAGPALLVSSNRTQKVEALSLTSPRPIVIRADCIHFAVPRNLERAQQIAQYCELLERCDPKPVRKKAGLQPSTLWKALACVYAKARYPDLELWRVGVLANAVDRFRDRIAPDGPRKLASQADMRRHLTLTVVRLIFLAMLVAENAAIGTFPSMARDAGVQTAFPFAEHQLHDWLSASGDHEYNYLMSKVGSRFLLPS